MRGNGPSEMVCSGAGDRSYFYFHCLADGLSSPSKDAAAPGLRRWTRTKQAAPRQPLTLTPCPTRLLTLNFRSISSLIYFLEFMSMLEWRSSKNNILKSFDWSKCEVRNIERLRVEFKSRNCQNFIKLFSEIKLELIFHDIKYR